MLCFRIINWNIKTGCDISSIAKLLEKYATEKCIINLQEVSEANYGYMRKEFPYPSRCSLDLRHPGKYEGRNRHMGVATFAIGGEIEDARLLHESVFPERTLFTLLRYDEASIKNLTFHSLTGVDYKKAKSSNFASIAGCINEYAVDTFSCDANEPQHDSIDDSEMVFYDNRDHGKSAELLFGKNKVHTLIDSQKELCKRNNRDISDIYSHIIGESRKRYDFIFIRKDWQLNDGGTQYSEALGASSDHALVFSDMVL